MFRCYHRNGNGNPLSTDQNGLRPQEKRFQLVEVKNREGESFEAMLRRFTRSVQHEGIISEARRRKAFEPPSVTRKKQIAAKVRKSRKSTEKNR